MNESRSNMLAKAMLTELQQKIDQLQRSINSERKALPYVDGQAYYNAKRAISDDEDRLLELKVQRERLIASMEFE